MKVLGVAPPVRELLRLSNSQPRQKKAGKGLRHFLALNVAFLGRRRQRNGSGRPGGARRRQPKAGQRKAGLGMHRN